MMTPKKSHRLAAAAVMSATIAVGLPASARADAPQPVPAGGFELPAGQACDFGLGVSFTDGQQATNTFTDKAGTVVRTFQVTTGISYTFKNLSTSKTITNRAGASATQTVVDANGVQTITARGHYTLIMFPTDVPAGPSTTLYVGQVVFTVDPHNNFTLLSTNGRSVDICAALS